MKIWTIPVCWEMFGVVKVQANTLEEAMYIAENDGSIPLPDGDYIDGSWNISEFDTEYIRQCYNDNQEDEEDK